MIPVNYKSFKDKITIIFPHFLLLPSESYYLSFLVFRAFETIRKNRKEMKQTGRKKLIAAAAATAAVQIIINNNRLTTAILRIAVINEIDKDVTRTKQGYFSPI